MAHASAIKDKDSLLDYTHLWSEWLAEVSDTIVDSTWVADDGIVIENQSNTTTEATVWLSGGSVGNQYSIVNEIETAGGRIDNRTLIVKVREK
jgi:hypothetical protein